MDLLWIGVALFILIVIIAVLNRKPSPTGLHNPYPDASPGSGREFTDVSGPSDFNYMDPFASAHRAQSSGGSDGHHSASVGHDSGSHPSGSSGHDAAAPAGVGDAGVNGSFGGDSGSLAGGDSGGDGGGGGGGD